MISLASQSFTIVDSTTDNQLPSMREWQNPETSVCPYYIGEMELESSADYQGNVNTGYQDKYSDIEEMESGGDPELGWVS